MALQLWIAAGLCGYIMNAGMFAFHHYCRDDNDFSAYRLAAHTPIELCGVVEV